MSDRNDMKRNQSNGNGAQLSGWPASHYQIPKEPGKNTALILAGVMHVLLFLFLWIGIHWQSKTPVGVDAEIWDVTTREAAPVPVEEVKPPPPEEVKTEPPKPSAQDVEEEHEVEIALERAKEKKLAEKKQLEEQKEEKKRQDDLEKEQKKQELAKIAEQKKENALAQKQRDDNLKRLTGQIAGTGGSGNAVKSTGNNRVDAGYAGKIAAKIKSNMVYVGSDNVADNPTVEFTIDLFPDGSLRGPPHKTKSSGVALFDNAVESAITKSAPYPADKSGNVPPTIPLTYRLKD
jgi:colicin import membrane protein